MRWKLILITLATLIFSLGAARATAYIHIDLSTQSMHVDSQAGNFSWPVSTARAGYRTPRGSYAPTGMQRMHFSRKYHMSPMPYSIFFRGGYAIHGTYSTGALGRPASHGCVRLSPGNARRLYEIVQSEGGSISITGAPPAGATRYARSASHRSHYAALGHHSRPSRAMAYAPARYHARDGGYDDDPYGAVRAWQAAPAAPYW
jgi:hypothetical protein